MGVARHARGQVLHSMHDPLDLNTSTVRQAHRSADAPPVIGTWKASEREPGRVQSKEALPADQDG
jgi:hypothetical protein